MAETHASVAYRKDPLTVADYDEAIEALQAARAALVNPSLMAAGCGICGDGGCIPATCHHNPLLLARVGAECRALSSRAAMGTVAVVPIHYFQCFHCGFVPERWEDARDHFGDPEDEIAACLQDVIEQRAGAAVDDAVYELERMLGLMSLAPTAGVIVRLQAVRPEIERVLALARRAAILESENAILESENESLRDELGQPGLRRARSAVQEQLP